jgi:hypothetical protein
MEGRLFGAIATGIFVHANPSDPVEAGLGMEC